MSASLQWQIGTDARPFLVEQQWIFADHARKTFLHQPQHGDERKAETAGPHDIADEHTAALERFRLFPPRIERLAAELGERIEGNRRLERVQFREPPHGVDDGRVFAVERIERGERWLDKLRPAASARHRVAYGKQLVKEPPQLGVPFTAFLPLSFATDDPQFNGEPIPSRARSTVTGQFHHGGATEVGTQHFEQQQEQLRVGMLRERPAAAEECADAELRQRVPRDGVVLLTTAKDDRDVGERLAGVAHVCQRFADSLANFAGFAGTREHGRRRCSLRVWLAGHVAK